ncbi:MAG TPA: hypothetical protein VEC17_02660 [Candidatus Binatia bacterium]|nr:hypothetical protein [Candidatus Binatia bacterium]
MEIKNFLKTRQQIIVLVLGYALVAGLSFQLGRINASSYIPPEIRVEEAFAPLNNTPTDAEKQLEIVDNSTTPEPVQTGSCKAGEIKGNISGRNKVYHLPGGSFYNRTTPEACFKTEAEAQAAGFRKSLN